jgi:hypothetical protein
MGVNNVTHTQKRTESSVQCGSDAVFLYCQGVIYHEFLPRGQVVNKEYYLKAVKRKRPDLWRGKKKWSLQHDVLWRISPF